MYFIFNENILTLTLSFVLRLADNNNNTLTEINNHNGTGTIVEIDGGQRIIRNEYIKTSYNYSVFHFTCAMAIMYTTAQLTKWFSPNEFKDFDKSWTTVGFKVSSSWLCGIVYLFYLLFPFQRRISGSHSEEGAELNHGVAANSLIIVDRNEVSSVIQHYQNSANPLIGTSHM